VSPKVLPTVLMAIDFFAAIPYAFTCDWRKAVYWTAAGILTLTVTW